MRKFILSSLLTLFAALLSAATLPPWLKVEKNGSFLVDQTRFRVVNFGPAHARRTLQVEQLRQQDGSIAVAGKFTGGNFRMDFQPDSSDAFQFRAKFAAADQPVEFLGLMLEFQLSGVARTVTLDGKSFRLPDKPEKNRSEAITRRSCNRVTIPLDNGALLTVSGQTQCKVFDDRASGRDLFRVRFYFQPFSGQLTESSLKLDFSLTPLRGVPLDLSAAANMGFADEVPGDGKGGWSDQGPQNDLHEFHLRTLPIGGTEFRILDPAANGGRATLVLGRTFPREATIPIAGRGNYLYLLHSAAWTAPEKAGELAVTFADGSTQRLPVLTGRDVGDWWNPVNAPNATVVWQSAGEKKHGKFSIYHVGLYFSQFKLKRNDPVKVTLRGGARQIWMVPAITLANGELPLRGNNRPLSITVGRDWVKLDVSRTVTAGSPLDFSGMLDAPAGKYGRVIVAPDGHFSFEKAPQKRIRFVGVNLCFRAQFLTHEESDALAERLARHGYNAIRIHHHDDLLVKKDAPDSLTIDPTMLDRLEYLFAACRKRGIYITTDVFVSRRLKAGDNIPEWVPNGKGYQMKALLPISRAAMENWKEFARRWLGHRNPYTGMTWAEDPALYIVSFTNENNLYATWREVPETAKRYQTLYLQWQKENHPGKAPGELTAENRRFQEFLHTLQHRSILEQAKFLREELGLKALRTDLNMHNMIPLSLTRNELDVVDDHKYHDHRRSAGKRWGLPYVYRQHSAIGTLGDEVPGQLFAARLFGKPFSVTEYKFCIPNKFRSEGGAVIGGYAALQNWDALYQFAWSQSDSAIRRDSALDSFAFVNDPLAALFDRLPMFLFRRGHVSPALERFAWNVPANFWNTDMPLEYPINFSRLGLIAGVGTVVDNRQVPGVQVISSSEAAGKAPLPDPKTEALRQTFFRTGVAQSSTGELRLDSRKKTLTIRTPHTLSATLASGNLTAGALTVRGVKSPSTISVSSLDQQPVARSGKLLLFHLTDVLDSGTAFEGDSMLFQTRWGKLPHLVRRAPAKVSLKLDGEATPKVEALRLDGTVCGVVKSSFRNGTLSFTADPGSFPGGVMVYWITRGTQQEN